MRLVFTGLADEPGILEPWRKRGCAIEFIPLDRLVGAIQTAAVTGTDAIITLAYPDRMAFTDEDGRTISTPLLAAIKAGREVRTLPPTCAMSDGRKWNAIPFVVMLGVWTPPESWTSSEFNGLQITMYQGDPSEALQDIRRVVAEYRKALLDELDDLGFLVSYDHGRLRVGLAIAPNASSEGHFYFGPADTRDRTAQCYTIDRDNFGIQLEVEEFECLINRGNVSESDLQEFFERYPHFLETPFEAQQLPHVRLSDYRGEVLVPDFILKPIVATQRDSRWRIIDLKLPNARLLAGKGQYVRFSQEVMKAIRQLRTYGEYFRDRTNADRIASILGHVLRRPRLGVLIGRLPSASETEALEVAQGFEADVQIVTYDEILGSQRAQLL